jgi:hypothetical protein
MSGTIDPAEVSPILANLQTDVAALAALVAAATTTPTPVPTPIPTPTPTPAPNGTALWPGKGGSFTDSTGGVWSFGTTPYQDEGAQIWGYNVLRNGVTVSGVAIEVLLLNGGVYTMNQLYQWQQWNGAAFVSCASPLPAPTPSPAGSSITGSSPEDFSQILVTSGPHYWSFGPSQPPGYWILKDGAQYASGNAIKLVIDTAGVMWSQNADGSWWKDNGVNWVPQGSGSPGPTL